MARKAAEVVVSRKAIESRIYTIRGERVMLDCDLAELYGVETRSLNQSVRRHAARFPSDFMFTLTKDEVANLRSQFVISSSWGGARYPPQAFTEQGVAMLSAVLNSEQAIRVNIEIMRAFIKLRTMATPIEKLARKLDQLEERYDEQFKAVFDAIRKLMQPPSEAKPKKQIGFRKEES